MTKALRIIDPLDYDDLLSLVAVMIDELPDRKFTTTSDAGGHLLGETMTFEIVDTVLTVSLHE